MEILKSRKNIFIICVSILLVIVLAVSYYGAFIYPEKQFRKQLTMLRILEQEFGLVLPNSSVFHSNSSMKYYMDPNEDYTNPTAKAYFRFNIVVSFNQKEYDRFTSDLKVWEVSGGERAESQKQIMAKRPDYYKNWKIAHSGGASEYDFFLRRTYVKDTDEINNQAVMIIKDEKTNNYKMYLTAQLKFSIFRYENTTIYYEFGRPISKACYYAEG